MLRRQSERATSHLKARGDGDKGLIHQLAQQRQQQRQEAEMELRQSGVLKGKTRARVTVDRRNTFG